MKRSNKVVSTHTHFIEIRFDDCVTPSAAKIHAHASIHYFAHTFKDHDVAIQYRKGSEILAGESTEDGVFIRVTGSKSAMEAIKSWKGARGYYYFTKDMMKGAKVSGIKSVPGNAVQVFIKKGEYMKGFKGCTVADYPVDGSTMFIRQHTTGGDYRYYRQYSVVVSKKVVKGFCDTQAETKGTIPSWA